MALLSQGHTCQRLLSLYRECRRDLYRIVYSTIIFFVSGTLNIYSISILSAEDKVWLPLHDVG
jgi:hypothetical protein